MPPSGAVIVQDSSWKRYARSKPRAQAQRDVGAQLGRAHRPTLPAKAAGSGGVPAQAAVEGARSSSSNTCCTRAGGHARRSRTRSVAAPSQTWTRARGCASSSSALISRSLRIAVLTSPDGWGPPRRQSRAGSPARSPWVRRPIDCSGCSWRRAPRLSSIRSMFSHRWPRTDRRDRRESSSRTDPKDGRSAQGRRW